MITSFVFAMLVVSVSGNPWTFINGTISAYVPVLPSPNTQLYNGEFYLVIYKKKEKYFLSYFVSLQKIQMSSKKILFVLTSHDKLLNGQPTGWFLPEVSLKILDFYNHFCYINRLHVHIMYQNLILPLSLQVQKVEKLQQIHHRLKILKMMLNVRNFYLIQKLNRVMKIPKN